jgi:hypothetical protein
MARNPNPAVGQRIRVTAAGGADDLVGATGTVAEVYDRAIAVDWDDAKLNRHDVTLISGVDRWEVTEDAPPPDA